MMVNFGVETVAEAMKLGQDAAEKVTEKFVKPIKLEFEKVGHRYIINYVHLLAKFLEMFGFYRFCTVFLRSTFRTY